MPKKPPRNNPPQRMGRTVQSAATLLQRVTRRAGIGAGELPTLATGGQLEKLRALLPENLRPHLIAVLEKSGELVIFADSAAWAARLKLAAPDLAALAAGRRLVVRLMPQQRKQKQENL